MIHLTARALAALPPTLDLDPGLRDLLRRRLAALHTPHGDLTPFTEYLIVGARDTEADVARHLGFSPLVDPVDGHRWPDPRFVPGWDLIHDHGGWYEVAVTFGSTFAYVLVIAHRDDVLGRLCRAYA